MTISIWRFSHLALALLSFIFIALLSITGIILSFEPVENRLYANDQSVSISQVLEKIQPRFEEIVELKRNEFGNIIISGIDTSGNNIDGYLNPLTGEVISEIKSQKHIYSWATNLHRSLFLKSTGRIIVLIASALLTLIAITGTILILRRQKGFFSRVHKDGFYNYYHVVTGRISLLFIIIISISGIILSFDKFGFFEKEHEMPVFETGNIKTEPTIKISEFPVFKKIKISDLKSLEFPFSGEPEDFFILQTATEKIYVNQFTGEELHKISAGGMKRLTDTSLDIHTGRKNSLWAIILGVVCVNILFFIFSGFKITLKRIKFRNKNVVKKEDAEYIILHGTENGSTKAFASEIHKQLINLGVKSYISDLNSYSYYPCGKKLLILTSTYGAGEPPANAAKFLKLLAEINQSNEILFSVVGFGSHYYPDFCKFAYEINNELNEKQWAKSLTEIHTVNDKSVPDFLKWVSVFSQKTGLNIRLDENKVSSPPKNIKRFKVTSISRSNDADKSFQICLLPLQKVSFCSGDILNIYPANNNRYRQYSIGKIGKEIQLSIKYFPGGFCSEYLINLKENDEILGVIDNSNAFYFPWKANKIIMVSNGTGIAPFLGMIDENYKKNDVELYCGFKNFNSYDLYKSQIDINLEKGKVSKTHIAFSREGIKKYVSGLLINDEVKIGAALKDGCSIMICGSLSMQKDVLIVLDKICNNNNLSLSSLQSSGRILMDCY